MIILLLIPLVCFAKGNVSGIDFQRYNIKAYTKEELTEDSVTFSGADKCYVYEIKALENGEKYLSMCLYANNTNGAGGSLNHNLQDAIEKGTVMLDVSVRADNTLITRNLFKLKSSDKKSVYTMSMTKENGLYCATQGTYASSKYFTGESYKTDENGFYNLRMVATRKDTESSWDFSVYDRLTSYTKPIYKIEIPASTLKDIKTVTTTDLWNTTSTKGYIDVKQSVLFTPTSEDVIIDSTITDERGKELTEFKGKNKLYLKYDAENITSEDANLCVYQNVYYGDVLVRTAIHPFVIEGKAKNTNQMLEIDLEGVTAYNSIEIVIWKTEGLVPVTPKLKIIYSSNGVEAYTLENKTSKVIAFVPQKRILANEAVASNFTVLQSGKKLDIEEVRLESATNTVRIYLKKGISVSDETSVKSDTLKCMGGEEMLIDCVLYPYIEESVMLYDIGFHRMTVYDNEGRQVSVVPEKGEYTVEIEFINNNSKVHEVKGTIVAKGNRAVELDKFSEQIENYSRYTYKKKFNLEKGDIISLIL